MHIYTEFAPNEHVADALLSFKLLLQPWTWYPRSQPAKQTMQTTFEKIISHNANQKYRSTLFFNGRSALKHLLQTLEYEQGSEIIVQGFTCEAVVLPIIASDLKPIYIDIEKETLSMDSAHVESAITSKTKAIIIQHTFGALPSHREKIIKIALRNNLCIIDDLAHIIPTTHYFDRINEQNKKHSANSILLLSFGRSKGISSVFGSIIATTDTSLYHRLNIQSRGLKNVSWGTMTALLMYKPVVVSLKKLLQKSPKIGKVIMKLISHTPILIKEISKREKRGGYDTIYDVSYPEPLAKLAIQQFRHIDAKEQNMLSIQKVYAKALTQTPCVKIFSDIMYAHPLIRFPAITKANREHMIQCAKMHNIQLGKWYGQVIAPNDFDITSAGYRMHSCPVAEDMCTRVINLPTHISLSQAEHIASVINTCCP